MIIIIAMIKIIIIYKKINKLLKIITAKTVVIEKQPEKKTVDVHITGKILIIEIVWIMILIQEDLIPKIQMINFDLTLNLLKLKNLKNNLYYR